MTNKDKDIHIMGQYYGEMLAETGSFDVLFWYWVLGIGVYTYIYMHYLLNIRYWGICM